MSNIVKINEVKTKPKSHVGVLGFLLVVSIVCFFLLSPIFDIKTIEVEGNETISNNYIVSASDILYGQNILRMNKFAVMDKINAIPNIESCSIKRIWPNCIIITVKEKEPVAKVKFYGSNLLITEDGVVVEVVTDQEDVDFLSLEGITAQEVVLGEVLNCNEEEKFKRYLEVLKKMKENDMLDGVIKISDKSGTLVYYQNGHIVYFGDNENLQRKIEWLKSVWEKEENPAYIDLHDLEHVITKPVWGMDVDNE